MSGQTLLLVDPLSSAEYLSETYRALGVHTVALYTLDLASLDPYIHHGSDLFDEQIISGSRDPAANLAMLAGRDIDYVVGCNENSVAIADHIANAITPDTCNDPCTSALRMQKVLMHEKLAADGLPHIRQRLIDPADVDLDDSDLAALRWPRFIKPSYGLGSVGTTKLNDRAELEAFLSTVDTVSLLDDIRAAVPDGYELRFLLSEYIDGHEYFVDSFSYLGQHYISSVQSYHKIPIDGTAVYRYAELVCDQSLCDVLIEYARSVLTSLGVRNGFAHTEVFLTADDQPVLIELNPRTSGASGFGNRLATAEHLRCQPAMLKAVLFDEFRNTDYVVPDRPRTRFLMLSNFSENPLPELEPFLRQYSSVTRVQQMRPNGYRHEAPPRSVLDLVALVLCQSEDPDQMVRESEEILQRDLQGW